MFFVLFMLCLRREWWRVYVGLQRTRTDTYEKVSDISGCVYERARASYNAIRCFFSNGTRLDLHRNRVSAVCLFGRIIQRGRRVRAHNYMNPSRMSATDERWKTNEKQKEREAAVLLIHSGAHRTEKTMINEGQCVASEFVIHNRFDMHTPDNKIDNINYR